jgi:hypothetical protein
MLFCSNQEIERMIKIKKNLEEVRHYFLRPSSEGKVTVGEIKVEIKNLIGLCEISNKNEGTESNRGTNFSDEKVNEQFLLFPASKNNLSDRSR